MMNISYNFVAKVFGDLKAIFFLFVLCDFPLIEGPQPLAADSFLKPADQRNKHRPVLLSSAKNNLQRKPSDLRGGMRKSTVVLTSRHCFFEVFSRKNYLQRKPSEI
jgi:hypothetical protein